MARVPRNPPFPVILMGIGAAAMYLPAGHAVLYGQHAVARPFFYGGTIFLTLTAMVGLATANRWGAGTRGRHLGGLLIAWLLLPAMLALPYAEALPGSSYFDAWFEMVSAFTTTGATVQALPEALPPSLHLWRALVGWFGGFFTLAAAMAILAPLNLGGMEVLADAPAGARRRDAPGDRLVRQALGVLPVYAGLTLALWILLLAAGERGMVAVSLAMGTLSTSGISPLSDLGATGSGRSGEALMALFLVFALSRRLLPGSTVIRRDRPIWTDPELRLGLGVILAMTAVLVGRTWVAPGAAGSVPDLGAAAWGTLFTTASMLTSTGYVSADWPAAHSWSGIDEPGLIFLGLAMVGGGVATTAGGVKLLRVYALIRQGEREVERLVHPSSVGGAGAEARRLRRQGARVAWIFFLLFAMAIGLVTALLTLTGLGFEPSLVLAIAALANNGPIAGFAAEMPIAYGALPEAAKAVLALGMVLGRMEILAALALLNPGAWRR